MLLFGFLGKKWLLLVLSVSRESGRFPKSLFGADLRSIWPRAGELGIKLEMKVGGPVRPRSEPLTPDLAAVIQ